MPGNAKEKQIMVVGDVHGVWSSLNRLINRKRPRMILQCGDFGYFPREKCPIMQRTNLGSERCAGIEYAFDPNTLVNNLVDGKRVPIQSCDSNHEDHEQLRLNIELRPLRIAAINLWPHRSWESDLDQTVFSPSSGSFGLILSRKAGFWTHFPLTNAPRARPF